MIDFDILSTSMVDNPPSTRLFSDMALTAVLDFFHNASSLVSVFQIPHLPRKWLPGVSRLTTCRPLSILSNLDGLVNLTNCPRLPTLICFISVLQAKVSPFPAVEPACLITECSNEASWRDETWHVFIEVICTLQNCRSRKQRRLCHIDCSYET